MSAKCSSCGAEILWVKTAAGKSMPLSIASKEKRFVSERGQAINYAGADVWGVTDTYLSHFADCPNAAQHRTKQ